MSQDTKELLIVDDTEIDRIILKSILVREFAVSEASNGTQAFDYITTKREQLDGILLDLSMPHIDGFDVLQFMKDKKIEDIPVFLVTAEPTRDNVERAIQYANVADFIGKPFDKEDVMRRLRSRLGVVPVFDRARDDMTETWRYISDLEVFYKNYLTSFGKNDEHYRVMTDLMEILLTHYTRTIRSVKLNAEEIKVISKAAYFCDIGEIMIPDKRLQLLSGQTQVKDTQKAHTEFGSSLIRLNRAPKCSFFVEVCAGMCLRHHERFDGKGYPGHIYGKNNSIYNQLCRLVDEFDSLRSKFYGDKGKPVSFVMKRMINDNSGMVAPEVYAMLEDCEKQIFNYFMKKVV